MKQQITKLGLLIFSAILGLSSCQKEEHEPNIAPDSGKYVTLDLDVSSTTNEEESARLYHYGDSDPNTIKVYLGKDGDKIPMRTIVYKGGTMFTKPIYSAVHDWVIENNGKTARYKGKIDIPKEKLADVEVLHLGALPERTKNLVIKTSDLMLLPTNGQASAVDLNVPILMLAPLVQTGNTIKNDYSPNAKTEGTRGIHHRFTSLAHMVQISIVNNLNVDVEVNQAVLVANQDRYGRQKQIYKERVYNRGGDDFAFGESILWEEQYMLIKPSSQTNLKIPAKSTERVIFWCPVYENTLSEIELTIAGRKRFIPIEDLPLSRFAPPHMPAPRLYPYTVTLN